MMRLDCPGAPERTIMQQKVDRFLDWLSRYDHHRELAILDEYDAAYTDANAHYFSVIRTVNNHNESNIFLFHPGRSGTATYSRTSLDHVRTNGFQEVLCVTTGNGCPICHERVTLYYGLRGASDEGMQLRH
jgi:hypothetical protein